MRFLTLVLTVTSLLATGPSAAPAERRTPPADLRADARLTRRIAWSGAPVPLSRAVALLHEQTGVTLLAQGELLRRPVAVGVRDRPAFEVMEHLALLFGGSWLRHADGYVLLADDVIVRAAAGIEKPRSARREERALRSSLTAAQMQQLARTGTLPYAALTAVQRRWLLTIVRMRWLAAPSRYPSSVLSGTEVRLRLSSVSPTSDERPLPSGSFTVVVVEAPSITDDGRLLPDVIAWLAPHALF